MSSHATTSIRFLTALSAVLLVLLCTPQAWANENSNDSGLETTVYDAQAAFDAIKGMEGEWIGTVQRNDGEARETKIEFKVSAGGHSIIQTFAPGKRYEMFSVYHLDGDQLLMTHYCALGNAPKMKFAESATPGALTFEFNGGTNLDPAKDAHAHQGQMRLMGPDHYKSESIGWANGKQASVQHFDMRRTESSADEN